VPSGTSDQNVFDIRPGAAIALFIKNRKTIRSVKHTDLSGKRDEKYGRLAHSTLSDLRWREIRPNSPNYFFEESLEVGDMDKGRRLDQTFIIGSTALQTSRDEFAIAFTETDIIRRGRSERRKQT